MEPMDDVAPTLPLHWPGGRFRPPPPDPAGTEGAHVEGPHVDGPQGEREGDPPPSSPEVVVRVSTRRRKTATAFWEGPRIVVVVPSHLRGPARTEMVDWLVGRVLAKRPRAGASDEALAERAAALADRYVDGVRPASIRWVTNQGKRWGSCTAQTREIRISHRLRAVPEWVLDATIVHELAHLLHADHSPGFHQVANRFPRQREAAIFLEGYSLGLGTGE